MPFAEIESFVIKKILAFGVIIIKIIDKHIHLFINFVAIPYRSGGSELLFITKGVIEIIFIS